MSITKETAKKHAKDNAITCCRFEAGTTIEASNLEDPAIFEDLEVSGLLEIPSDCLTIEEVLGAKLTETVDALTPLTKENLEGINEVNETNEKETEEVKDSQELSSKEETKKVKTTSSNSGGVFKLSIGEGKDINLEIPMSAFNSQNEVVSETVANEDVETKATEVKEEAKESQVDKIGRAHV